jgi:hypothetical protein
MASTRNKNTSGNYCLEQKQNVGIVDFRLFKNGANGTAFDTKLPGNGLNPGQFNYDSFSNNSADIESFLFGINSTNLVNPHPVFTPEFKCLRTANIYENSKIVMPQPLNIVNDQRPHLY